MQKWFKRGYSGSESTSSTSTNSEFHPLLPNDRRRETRYVEGRSEMQGREESRQEAKGPNIWTGEGTESQKLEAEKQKLWKRIKGAKNVEKEFVTKLSAAFDEDHRQLVNWADSDNWSKAHENVINKIFDCDRELFKGRLRSFLKWKDGSLENFLDGSNGSMNRCIRLNCGRS